MVEVSVVIPCFNQGHYLKQALDSVLSQEAMAWEALVVDDGSSDDTAAVAKAYDDLKVRYHFQENRGLSGARNAGIQLTQGDYLTFLDADDEWEPVFLDRCLAALAETPEAPGVYAGSRFIDEEGRMLPQGSKEYSVAHDFRRRLLEGGFFPVHAAMVRREALVSSGGFDESLSSLEDWDLWLRLSQTGIMRGIPERLALYRVYARSMSTDAERMQTNRLAVLAKHFGPATGEVAEWDKEKRYAFAFAHRNAALAFLEQGRANRCWQAMDEAVRYWPAILEPLDTYYELGCGQQSKGYRGRPTVPEIQANGAMVLGWLENLFGRDSGGLQRFRKRAFGQAYLALGMLADQADDYSLARGYLRGAVEANPRMVTESGVFRRLVKVHLGKRALDVYKRLEQ